MEQSVLKLGYTNSSFIKPLSMSATKDLND